MKVVHFTIPVAKENAVIVQEDNMPHFYNHLHRHNETQITWIIKGEGTLIAGNYMQTFKAGDLYIIGANQPHVFRNDIAYFTKRRKQAVHALTIFFNPNGFLQSVLQLPETKTIKKFVDATSFGLQAPTNKLQIITSEMLVVKSAKNGYRLSAFIHLLQLLADIKNWNTLTSISPENSFSDSEGLRMNSIYQFTLDNYNENIKLKQVADIAFLTPQAFCRYFKKHTRKTYIDFLNEIRINEACKKIVTGNFESIASIAVDTGFNSTANFCRVFKKVTQQSPLQYRKMYEDNTMEK
jgi:AraC-like DNA-binding protein